MLTLLAPRDAQCSNGRFGVRINHGRRLEHPAGVTCMIRSKLKAPSRHRVNSPLLFPVMHRVAPSGAHDSTFTGDRCLLTLALIQYAQMEVAALSPHAAGGSMRRVYALCGGIAQSL